MTNLLQDMDRVYTGLQHLSIKPTKNNVAILLDTLTVMEKAYTFIQEHEKEADDGDDPAGKRDAD